MITRTASVATLVTVLVSASCRPSPTPRRSPAGQAPLPAPADEPHTEPVTEPVAVADLLDVDGDMVLDECDRCPREREFYNGTFDDDGCPDNDPSIRNDWGVRFDERSATVSDEWFLRALSHLAARLVADPAAERIAVVGRATEDEAHPMKLSEQRARFVIDVLTAAGVSADRLEVHALGDAPVSRHRDAGGRWDESTALVVLREGGRDFTLDDGDMLFLVVPVPAPRVPKEPGCPAGLVPVTPVKVSALRSSTP